MKREGLLLLVAIPLVALGGCQTVEEVFVREFKHKGTTLGYSSCIKDNTDVGLTEEVVRRLCSQRHSRYLERTSHVALTGRAGYETNSGELEFSGHLENPSDSKFVVTGAAVTIRHSDNKDDKGQTRVETVLLRDLWIEPGRSEPFT